MKKRTVFLTSLLLVLSMVFMGCGEKPGKNADPITVTFVVNGGSAIEPVEVGEDGLVQLPADPTKEGNKFAGWFTDEALTTAFDETVEITEDITIYAKWIVNTYTVTFESNGGSKVDPATVEYKKTATKPTDPTAEGKYFAGWFTDKEFTKVFEFTTEITADITLYAKWTTDPVYSITIKYNISGEKDGDVKATKDKEYKIEVPSKTRDGYTVKWYSDEVCTKEVDFTKPFSADATVYAKWTVIEYTITYVVGDNATAIPSAKYTVEDEVTLPEPVTNEGFSFIAWYTEDTYTTEITKIEKGSTGNKIVYAKIFKPRYILDLEKEPTAAYEGITIDLSTVLPEGINLSDYMYLKINASFYNAEGNEIVYNYDTSDLTGQIIMLGEGDWNSLAEYYNISPAGNSLYDSNYVAIPEGLKKIAIQNAAETVKKFTVNYIELVPAVTGAVAYANPKEAAKGMVEGKTMVIGYVMTAEGKNGWGLGGLRDSGWSIIDGGEVNAPDEYTVGEVVEQEIAYTSLEDWTKVDGTNFYNDGVYQYVYIK